MSRTISHEKYAVSNIEILSGIESDIGHNSIDIVNHFDHVFWAGDLNYRQNDPGWTRATTQQQKFDCVQELATR